MNAARNCCNQPGDDRVQQRVQHRRDQLGLRGKLANRSGMGSESTHWRTGTSGMTWSTRCAAVCDMRRMTGRTRGACS